MPKCRLILLLTVIAAALLAPAGSGTAQDVDGGKATSVKAGLVYKFTRFVRWPKRRFGAETDPFIIVVPADEDFAKVLRVTTNGRETGGRPIKVIVPEADADDADVAATLDRCHLLYVSEKSVKTAQPYLAAACRKPILCVSDAPDFASKQGMIGLVVRERTVQFEINLGRVRESGLKIHSNLLSLATVVESEGDER